MSTRGQDSSMNTKPKVVHEAEAQRQHMRVKLPLQAIIEEKTYKVLDWSVAGFAVEGLFPIPKAGDMLTARLVFPFAGFTFTLLIRAEVLHAAAATQRSNLRFIDVTPEQSSLLHFIIGAYVSGELVTAGDLLEVTKRNLLVAPRSIPAPDRPHSPLGATLQTLRRVTAGGMLVLVGMLVFGYAVLAVYAHAFVTDGKGVVVSPEVQLARAQVSGTLIPKAAAKGQRVAAGELIAVIEAPDGTAKPVESSCDCLIANQPLPKGAFVSRGTVIARLVPLQAPTQIEIHIPLERLDGIAKGQRVRIELFSGQAPSWGFIDRVDRHTPIDATAGIGDSSYGVIMVNADLPLPASAVGEPAAVHIHRVGWLGRRAEFKATVADSKS